ncbi:MAG TPA: acyl carrier protein [Pseudomonas xinjiangensis]|uniref:Acyl carrier protein n=2 Tax=root TaxID=1 RepID=A0A7V1FS04_9GAMM|nr:acyl carrier protein [Halopseudomonas xinjiangensis]HEC48623.1 acyl carrier protein [Halopseudomonas xinjiangensis]
MSTDTTAANTDVFTYLSKTLVDLFDVDPKRITTEARLYEDLDIDSIDAVDMVVELKRFTGRRIDPEDFKAVRTVQDVIDAVDRLMQR